MKLLPIGLVLSFVYLHACNNPEKGSASDNKADSTITAVKDNTQLKIPVTTVISNGLSSENLVLTSIREGAYPLANLHAEWKDGRSIDLIFNQEDQDYSGPTLQKLKSSIGKSIQVTFATTLKNNAMVIGLNNVNILDGKPINATDNWDLISGTLEAPAVSEGDLPDTFYIKKSDGNRMAFPFFITKEMIGANGFHVDVYYSKNEVHLVRSIHP